MKIEKVNFNEAVKILVDKAGIHLPKNSTKKTHVETKSKNHDTNTELRRLEKYVEGSERPESKPQFSAPVDQVAGLHEQSSDENDEIWSDPKALPDRLELEMLELWLADPTAIYEFWETLPPERCRSPVTRTIYETCNALIEQEKPATFERLMVAFDGPKMKSFLVELNKSGQTKIAAIAELKIRAKKFHLAEYLSNNVVQTIERLKEKDENGMTALHLAARDIPDPVVIRCLIALGADVNAKDNRGMTPLHWATACNPNVDVVKCLVNNGANIRAEDDKGVTPMDLFLRFAKSEEVGLYFLELLTGQKGVEVTDPARLAEIKQRFSENGNE